MNHLELNSQEFKRVSADVQFTRIVGRILRAAPFALK